MPARLRLFWSDGSQSGGKIGIRGMVYGAAGLGEDVNSQKIVPDTVGAERNDRSFGFGRTAQSSYPASPVYGR